MEKPSDPYKESADRIIGENTLGDKGDGDRLEQEQKRHLDIEIDML